MANEKKREGFGSRLGFILVSAGCAIGIGNVWKFPYLCGKYGGAAFILIYLLFLLILGIRACRHKLAPPEVHQHRRLLHAHDVLHDCRRLDAVLLLPKHPR